MFIYPVLHTLHTVHLAEMVHALLVLLLPLVNVVLANRLRQLGAPTQVKAKAFNLVLRGPKVRILWGMDKVTRPHQSSAELK